MDKSIEMRLKALEKAVYDEDTKEIKRIDMSVCIESQVDCEFSNTSNFLDPEIGRLTEITNSDIDLFRLGNDTMYHGTLKWARCRPRFNHIHGSPTGWDKCPIPEGFVISIWGMEREHSSDMEWYKALDWSGIDMFEITGIQEGYEL